MTSKLLSRADRRARKEQAARDANDRLDVKGIRHIRCVVKGDKLLVIKHLYEDTQADL